MTLTVNTFAAIDNPVAYAIVAVLGAALLVVGFAIGFIYRKKVAEKKIKSAETQAEIILDNAKKEAERRKKEIIVEGKEEILKNKNESERELKERRNEINRLERRALQKEENIDRKIENLEKKEEQYNQKLKNLENKESEIEGIRQKQIAVLEEYSGMSSEQAKAFLIERIESEARHDAALKVAEIEQELKDTADEKAKNIITMAIQRCAANHVTEATVSVVMLPNDDMKGRIIGREGRNIRTIENLTGVDLIIDDMPEAITLSSFDPMRREIARIAIEKLMTDGRISDGSH